MAPASVELVTSWIDEVCRVSTRVWFWLDAEPVGSTDPLDVVSEPPRPMEEVLFEPDKPVETGERDFKGSDSVKLEATVVESDTLTDSLVGIPVTDALTTPDVV